MFPPTIQPHPIVIWDFAVGTALLAFSTGARSRPWRRALRLLGYVLIGAGIQAGLAR